MVGQASNSGPQRSNQHVTARLRHAISHSNVPSSTVRTIQYSSVRIMQYSTISAVQCSAVQYSTSSPTCDEGQQQAGLRSTACDHLRAQRGTAQHNTAQHQTHKNSACEPSQITAAQGHIVQWFPSSWWCNGSQVAGSAGGANHAVRSACTTGTTAPVLLTPDHCWGSITQYDAAAPITHHLLITAHICFGCCRCCPNCKLRIAELLPARIHTITHMALALSTDSSLSPHRSHPTPTPDPTVDSIDRVSQQEQLIHSCPMPRMRPAPQAIYSHSACTHLTHPTQPNPTSARHEQQL
jgi:hypothetical protein